MIIEATELKDVPVVSSGGARLGTTSTLVFNGQTTRLAGFGVDRPGLLKKTAGLPFEDTLAIAKEKIAVDSEAAFLKDTKPLDELFKRYGSVIGVTAKTESGNRIGKIMDVFLEAETGLMIRFYLKSGLKEQIIPRQFLVALTPQQVVFKDVVDQPIFDQVATLETLPAEKSLALSNE